MEEFEVILTKTAEKDSDGLDPKIRLTVLKAAKCLKTSPFPRGKVIKRLKGTRMSLYRLRVGDYRVVYHIDGKRVAVLFITDRKDLEKRLKAFY